jgi:GDSL-like Lipase/Acylhydrolase family/N-terminus of Esterase_SGNH_hydro-type
MKNSARSLLQPKKMKQLNQLGLAIFIMGLVWMDCSGQCLWAQEAPATAKLDPAMDVNRAAADGLRWHDITQLGVEGRILPDQERDRWFDRLPSSAESAVTPNVWNLSRDSAGMMVRFRTDANAIHVHYKLRKANLAMPHMPATGVSGVDLYARDNDGIWKWVQVTKPAKQEVKAEIVSGLAPGDREYAAYLPLYNGVEFMSIGVPQNAKFENLAPREKPIVFYGTSITHGACASRPGIVHTAILGRHLDRAVVNLGFSGNGRMDEAVGNYLVQIDAAAYVIDCLPNMNPQEVSKKCIPLVKQIRQAKPSTPILLVEDRRMTNDWILPAKAKFHTENHAALRQAYDTLVREGDTHLHYIPGDHLYGDDTEGATDASHANDLGFMRQADVFEPILRAALGL